MAQIVRLNLGSTVAWLAADYLGRVGALSVVFAIPAARRLAVPMRPLHIRWWECVLWIVFLPVAYRWGRAWLGYLVPQVLPNVTLGPYPQVHGALFAIDATFGLALVAFTEELIFRQFLYRLVRRWTGEGLVMLLATSMFFGAYHWWSGFPNMIGAAAFGLAAMIFYQRSRALWPVASAYYLTDLFYFSTT